MLKIELSDEQTALLKRIEAPYDPNQDYDEGDTFLDLLEFIRDYVVMHEIKNDEVTDFGAQLLDIQDYIVEKYDS